MAFLIGLLVNAILLSIPIGASLGTMIVIRPFRNERVPLTESQNAILEMSFCDDSHTFHQFSQNKNGVNFTSKWGRASLQLGSRKATIRRSNITTSPLPRTKY
jgi:hypothetical protein